MPDEKPRIPPHPHGYRCDTCKFWLEAGKQEMVLDRTGQGIPLAQARALGMPIVGLPRAVAAPCIWGPAWIIQPAEMYCWQWRAKDVEAS